MTPTHPTPNTPTTRACLAADTDGYKCSKRAGHVGLHVATGTSGAIYRTWSEPPNPHMGKAVVTEAKQRALLVDVLVYHYRTPTSGCGCGWAELGRSHPEHVADVYFERLRSAR